LWRIAGRIGNLKRRLLSKSHAQDGTVCVAAKQSSVCDWARRLIKSIVSMLTRIT